MIEQPLIKQLAILVSHDRDYVPVPCLTDQRHQTARARYRALVRCACQHEQHLLDQLIEPLHALAAQVLRLVHDLDHIRAEGSDLTELHENLIAAIASGPHTKQEAPMRRPNAVHDLQQRLQPRLVVGQIDHDADHSAGDRDAPDIHPSRVVLARIKRPKALGYLIN